MKIKITEINISERMRKDYGDLEKLADSLARHGQLQPIILDGNNFLVAGGRRLAAAKHLQWDEIYAIRREDLDPISSKEIELEENLQRKELHWSEEVVGVEALFNLKQEKYGKALAGGKGTKGSASLVDRLEGKEGYSLTDLGEDLERTGTSLSMDLTLARAIKEYPQLKDEASKSAAFKRYRLLFETAARQAMAQRKRDSDPAITKSFDDYIDERKEENKQVFRQKVLKTVFKERGSVLYHGDSRDVLRKLSEWHIKVDSIITDPPFGLGMHKEGQTTSGSRLAENVGHMYDDDPHVIMDMLDEVFMWASKVLKPDGHAYVFFHMTRYEQVYLMLRKHFGECDETPIVWIKNTPGIGDPNRTWVYAYEPCFFINRGRMLLTPQAFNYLKYDTVPSTQKIHPTEKPAPLLRHLVNASCVAGEVILDPFAGSGSTLVAADQVGCKFIGIEREEEFYRASVERLAERLGEREAKEKAGLTSQSETLNGVA